ncbi:MAG: bacteriohemerythrin [Solirubrobacterales bacterium]
MVTWKEEYRIGIEIIDEQHIKLFEIAGRAYDLLKNNWRTDKYDEIVDIMEELKEYTAYHFKTEEDYMESISYKRIFSQKVQHQEFITKINSIDLKKVDENQAEYLLGILEFIAEWIESHILVQDKLIGAV